MIPVMAMTVPSPLFLFSFLRRCLFTKQAAIVLNSTATARKQIVATMPATTGLASPRSSTVSGGGKKSVKWRWTSGTERNSWLHSEMIWWQFAVGHLEGSFMAGGHGRLLKGHRLNKNVKLHSACCDFWFLLTSAFIYWLWTACSVSKKS